MNDLLALATGNGLVLSICEESEWRQTAQTLTDSTVTSVIATDGSVLAGTTDGVFRSDDQGNSWQPVSEGLTVRHVRWLARRPGHSGSMVAGTEPAAIFTSRNGRWQECPEVAVLRDTHRWWLPYSPEAGCVRGFAFHGSRGYAAVEVGGVLRSDDAGETWRLAGGSTGVPIFDVPAEPLVHSDVHSVEVHPSSPDLVFAATAEGLYRSADGGATWSVTHAGSYCRAVWIDPSDSDHIVLGPADSVSKNGRIEQTRDGGHTWTLASEGCEAPWPHHMVERFVAAGDKLLAILSNGDLLAADVATLHWQRVLPGVADVNGVAVIH